MDEEYIFGGDRAEEQPTPTDAELWEMTTNPLLLGGTMAAVILICAGFVMASNIFGAS